VTGGWSKRTLVRRWQRLRLALVVGAVAVLVPAAALAHVERPTSFPDPARGAVPPVRTSGKSLVVCKPDSRVRIERLKGLVRERNAALLRQCAYRHIQEAVDAATNGTRILVLPGVYREEPSRAAPEEDPRCADLTVEPPDRPGMTAPAYAYHRRCPNAHNLIAIAGDSNDDGVCDDKCDLQIEGTGASPADVVVDGDQGKLNIIRGDRADGIVLLNFTVQKSDFNNVYLLETNGFRLERIVSRWSKEYGFLTFTTDHGLYDRVVAYGNGDSGLYPGSAPEGGCRRYGIEIRNSEAYGNMAGYSGTAGNSVWVHHSRFHDNVVGLVTDSAFSGHPGMPQDCAKWERNEIYSNNLNPYTPKRNAYCRRPYAQRDPRVLCPSLPLPVGTGLIILGGNSNLVRRNWIYDNWRAGASLYWVPALARGEDDPAKATDTSHGNRFLDNRMGMRPDGRRAPNGLDFLWDGEGTGNCWQGNRTPPGRRITSDPRALDRCPGRTEFRPANGPKFAELVACINWNPFTNPYPKGCTWYVTPKRPR
jgi:hypothetical protein